MNADYERVRRAIVYLDEHATEQPSLDDVARHVGLSPHHFQRLFRRYAGVSPKRFVQYATARRAQELLRDSRTVLDASFEAGLSGPGRLHDLIVTTDAVTPGEVRSEGAGLTIRYGIHETPFGPALIGVTDRGVCALRFVDEETAPIAIAELADAWRNADLEADDDATSAVVEQIFSHATDGRAGELPLLLRGTNFQIKVWEGLLRVPDGCLISYGDLADRLGVPRATRAVASAVGANPIAYVIPCHRVLRSTGAIGGYRWGVDRKRVMLGWELSGLEGESGTSRAEEADTAP